jgi:hypothetical protein
LASFRQSLKFKDIPLNPWAVYFGALQGNTESANVSPLTGVWWSNLVRPQRLVGWDGGRGNGSIHRLVRNAVSREILSLRTNLSASLTMVTPHLSMCDMNGQGAHTQRRGTRLHVNPGKSSATPEILRRAHKLFLTRPFPSFQIFSFCMPLTVLHGFQACFL